MKSPRPHLWLGMVAIVTAGLLASCQAVFTFSPLSFLRRDPSTLTTEQQVEFAEDALGSGDPEAVQDAYDVIQEAAAEDPTNPDLQYLAGQLALELSGVGDVLDDLMGGGGDLVVDEAAWETIDQDMLEQAGQYMVNADALDADLTATDYLVGAVGLLIAGADPGSDVVDTADTNPNLAQAQDFLTQGIAELPPDDPAAAMLQALLDSISA